jgi:dihydrofolate reductase
MNSGNMKWISIAAVSKNGVIGLKNQLPWNIPEDLKYFKDSTRGHPVVMGRKTFESLGKPLPNRPNIILSRDPNLVIAGAQVVTGFADAKKLAMEWASRDTTRMNLTGFVIGGAQIYAELMNEVDEVWLTEIDSVFQGDTYFPHYQDGQFKLAVGPTALFQVAHVIQQADSSHSYSYRFVQYSKK